MADNDVPKQVSEYMRNLAKKQAAAMTAKQRQERARRAVQKRWEKAKRKTKGQKP